MVINQEQWKERKQSHPIPLSLWDPQDDREQGDELIAKQRDRVPTRVSRQQRGTASPVDSRSPLGNDFKAAPRLSVVGPGGRRRWQV